MSKDVNGVDPLEYMSEEELKTLESLSYVVETLTQDEMMEVLVDQGFEQTREIPMTEKELKEERKLTDEENKAENERFERVESAMREILHLGEEWELISLIRSCLEMIEDIPYKDYNEINKKVDDIYW